jgi:hypothetical protein
MPQLRKEFTAWFDYPGGGRVEIVHLADEVEVGIQSQTNINRQVVREGKVEHELVINTGLDRKLTTQAAVRSWEGFTDENGKVMECDDHGKARWSCNTEFWLFVVKKRGELAVLAKKKEAELLKN